jgi:uncharacterized protein
MKIGETLLLSEYEDKLLTKHGVIPVEVEDVLLDRPHIRFIERGSRADEDLYAAYGPTRAGRYLVVFLS